MKWSRFVRTYLKGKGRLSHLDARHKPKEKGFEAWDEVDFLFMSSWLWDSMDPKISDSVMFFTSSKVIWESIKRAYSKAHDTSHVYEIKIKVFSTKRGRKSITEYATQLQNLWQELDHYRVVAMKFHEDSTTLKNFIDKDRVYEFLAGLNPEFDQVRVQML
ncbi:uncharacterized protein [Primulina eburnea]|uniref:uncharacterized protein n=1 Tax=Primulina eburnea TaxID=1245227 RepID=UPI003C6C22E9